MHSRVTLLGFLSLLSACASVPPVIKTSFHYDPSLTQSAPFVEHIGPEKMQSYLAMNLPYAPVERMRQDLENRLSRPLINRSEAHITVITPLEYDNALGGKISIKKINDIANQAALQDAPIEFICMGRGSANLNGHGEQTYFMVVKAPRLLEIRHAVRDTFIKNGGDPNSFDADHFFPHVTVGFTKRDLHFEDGVIKNESSCLATLEKTAL